MNIAIIGGGAAGYFAAISAKTHHPDASVIIYEKTNKVLSKVKVSGGGRCNVTSGITSPSLLSKQYPRGGNQLKKLFSLFGSKEMQEWLEDRGVELYTQEDMCVFPKSDNAQTIIDCFLEEVEKLGVLVNLQAPVVEIRPSKGDYSIFFRDGQCVVVDKIIITTGGQPKETGLDWLKHLGHDVVRPVPSLFTFNMPDESIRSLMGVVVNPACVRIQGLKLNAEGPLLITHWGMSGPAILKLSAWGARILNEKNYQFKVHVNWLNDKKDQETVSEIKHVIKLSGKKLVKNQKPFELPNRLWEFLLKKAGIEPDRMWNSVSKKEINRLANFLVNDEYDARGKTTFKEEFVTCGGVDLNSVNMKTMESKSCPGIYFSGELLDIDGVTGGFNFQAAWTTAFVAGKIG